MSLSPSGIAYLSRLHRQKNIEGPIVTYGRQMIFATITEARTIIESMGITPQAIPSEFDTGQLIPDLKNIPPYSNYTNDRTIFKLITGNTTEALDISENQAPDFICDLEQQMPKKLLGKYGFVLDGGTIEHIFDIATALNNTVDLLKHNGRILHITPISGYVDHGYYQPSPDLYFDFYSSNGFDQLDCAIAELPIKKSNHAGWNFWQWDRNIRRKCLLSEKPLLMFFTARKRENVSHPVVQDYKMAQGYSSTNTLATIKPWGLEAISELSPAVVFGEDNDKR